MSLRTRLFLWIGAIFLLAFGVSLYFETRSTDQSLHTQEKQIKEQILQLNEIRRQHIENYIRVALSEDQAQIDSLLFQIAREPLYSYGPSAAAELFKSAQWIDFIQSTREGKLTSLLIPIAFPMGTAYLVPIDDRISWIILDQDKDFNRPFLGVHVPEEGRWNVLALFLPETLKSLSTVPEGSPFLENVKHGADYVRSLQVKNAEDIASKAEKTIFEKRPLDVGIRCLEQEGQMIDDRVIQLLQRADQSILLSILAGLPLTPKGITRFTPNNPAGHVILTGEAFFQTKVFDDARYFKRHPGTGECQKVGPSIAVIAPENLDRVFVGNTLELQSTDYLTIAIDMGEVIQDLVLSSRMSAFLVHRGKVISAYNEEGKRLSHAKDVVPFDEKMLEFNSGSIPWKGKTYYYQQMVPFKGLDLHFFTFENEEKAFAILHMIEEGSREAIKKVSFDMRIISVVALALVLMLLHNVARRITKPISALARVTKQVAAGQLEDIELPQAPDGRNDEVSALCASFAQMVTGLKEKEKVKGVLNKVVSPEIAREIMKGQIHLGGEERKVTVLFADIRNFTGTSLHMDPHQVIEMLNTCMTKISKVIDEFGGVIDKYVGDEVMALFGAPIEKEESALKAVQCALKMVETLKIWNEERKKEGKVPIEMGIGIHTGEMIIGNMGAENRLNYTVIGSNVNFAARLCSSAKRLEILISKETLNEPHVKDNIEVELLTPIELKGFTGTFSLYRVKGEKNV